MDLLMDDAVSDAETALESGQSSFHKVPNLVWEGGVFG